MIKRSNRLLHFDIDNAIDILVKLKNVVNVKDMTVILWLDDLHVFRNDGTKFCDFSRVLSPICSLYLRQQLLLFVRVLQESSFLCTKPCVTRLIPA